jgi:hypothetical protein
MSKHAPSTYHQQILKQQAARQQTHTDQAARDARIAAYRAALRRIVDFQPTKNDNQTDAWAAVFCEATQALQEHHADFLADEWLEGVNQREGDPVQCAALELFAWASAADREAIAKQLQLATDCDYLEDLRTEVCRVASFFESVGLSPYWAPGELPWTPAYKSMEQLAHELAGLPGWSRASITRKLANKVLDARGSVAGTRYRAVDPVEQQAILQHIRTARSGHIRKREDHDDT